MINKFKILIIDDETEEIIINDKSIMSLNYDEHGSDAMCAVRDAVKAIAEEIGASFVEETD